MNIDPQSRADYLAHWEKKLNEAIRDKEHAERMLGLVAIIKGSQDDERS